MLLSPPTYRILEMAETSLLLSVKAFSRKSILGKVPKARAPTRICCWYGPTSKWCTTC
ncbi:cartilage matrix protein [Biomphalaria glabrata]|nr:cartilage matrix protein [Biomphalaria glabrata]